MFAAVQESAFGTKRTRRDKSRMSAFGGKADKRRGVALIALSRMTHSGSLFQS